MRNKRIEYWKSTAGMKSPSGKANFVAQRTWTVLSFNCSHLQAPNNGVEFTPLRARLANGNSICSRLTRSVIRNDER
jgi:hypothetical protein